MDQAEQADHEAHEQVLADVVEEQVHAGLLRQEHQDERIEEGEDHGDQHDHLLLGHLLELGSLQDRNVQFLHTPEVELERETGQEHQDHEGQDGHDRGGYQPSVAVAGGADGVELGIKDAHVQSSVGLEGEEHLRGAGKGHRSQQEEAEPVILFVHACNLRKGVQDGDGQQDDAEGADDGTDDNDGDEEERGEQIGTAIDDLAGQQPAHQKLTGLGLLEDVHHDEDENHQQGDTVAQGGRYNGGCRVVARDHAGCQRDHGGQQQAAGDDAHVDPADHNAQVLNAHSGHRAPRGDKVTGDEHDQQ